MPNKGAGKFGRIVTNGSAVATTFAIGDMDEQATSVPSTLGTARFGFVAECIVASNRPNVTKSSDQKEQRE